jgi:hypothetical protein
MTTPVITRGNPPVSLTLCQVERVKGEKAGVKYWNVPEPKDRDGIIALIDFLGADIAGPLLMAKVSQFAQKVADGNSVYDTAERTLPDGKTEKYPVLVSEDIEGIVKDWTEMSSQAEKISDLKKQLEDITKKIPSILLVRPDGSFNAEGVAELVKMQSEVQRLTAVIDSKKRERVSATAEESSEETNGTAATA